MRVALILPLLGLAFAQAGAAKPTLHELVKAGDLSAVESSVTAKRVNREDKAGNTALHYAAGAARADIVSVLLANGAEINALNSKYQTSPLHDLARTVVRDRKAVNATAALLLDGGSDAMLVDGYGETAFAAAARTGNRFVVRAILEHSPVSPEARSQALALAREFGRLGVIRLLERRGVESSEGGEAGLLNAASSGDYALTDTLLGGGTSPDVRGPAGVTPLMLSVQGGHTELARLLIERGAAPRAQDADGRTALHLASARGHRDLIDELLAAGADINAASADHGTPVVSAAERERVDTVQYLIERGARPADVSSSPEAAFGSGLAWQIYADHHAAASPAEATAEHRARAREHLDVARSGFEQEREDARKLRKRKERGEMITEALAATIAVAAVASLEAAYEANRQANQRQLVQIMALNDASSYADYHRRYDMYSRAMLKPARSDSVFRDSFHLDLEDTRVANRSSFPGLDVIISEYDRRIALIDKLNN